LRVTISGWSESEESGFCVADNGIGFDARDASRIFEVFMRLAPRGTGPEGVGVGLAICRKIVERHGGSISAEGRPGEGAVFTVRLPKRAEE
jgi:signal transduction histidine kinase